MFVQFCGDFFPYETVLKFHSMQIYVDVCGTFIILNPTGSLLTVCLHPFSLFTFLFLCCLFFVFFFFLPSSSMFMHSEKSLLGK